MVTVLGAVDDGGELATHPAIHTGAEDCGDLVARAATDPAPEPRSNNLWMGKCRLKMKLRQYSIWAIA